ncbi:unnamed protein product [Pseudo-nitzschia multistriata]|uniref:Pseudouridine synthase RsuA/RluA-like domain-containing protein n=1 Tax=Pseudo-nitzschia multistriata TaxID=183589 RepID=A0A448ZS35_9STRA|nr:unnamed protein product [Pseudo-nitzschia multistriata]
MKTATESVRKGANPMDADEKPRPTSCRIGSPGVAVHRRCRAHCGLPAVSLAFLWSIVSLLAISVGVAALSGHANTDAGRTHRGFDGLSVAEARERFDAWKTANRNTNTVREVVVTRGDLEGRDDRGTRISHFAPGIFPESLPTSNAANLACRSGTLTINGARVSGGRLVVSGDVVGYLNDKSDRRTTVPGDPKRAERFCASRLRLLQTLGDGGMSHSPLRVLYEDDAMAIVCKPAGIHTMSWSGSLGKSLCLDEILPLVLTPPSTGGNGLDDDEPLPAPLPRHRLDQRVAGPVVVAKTRRACVEIGRSFEEKTVTKEYRAIVVGTVDIGTLAERNEDPKQQIIFSGEGNPASSPFSFTIRSDVDGKPSETDVLVLGSTPCNVNGVLTDLKLFPKTGRKHQLRIHCAKVLGTPILGDDLYWGEQEGSVRRRQGLFLYCRKVSLGHPLDNGRTVSGETTEPLRFDRTRVKALKGFEWSKAREEEAAVDSETTDKY